jgi:hypothetical protein
MNYKQKALDHVRSVCEELMELSFGCEVQKGINSYYIVDYDTDLLGKDCRYWLRQEDNGYRINCRTADEMKSYKVIGHTPHLEDWLRGIKDAEKDSDYDWWGITVDGDFIKIDEYNPNGSLSTTKVTYNLTKDGENQDGSFYEAYCSIVGLTTT